MLARVQKHMNGIYGISPRGILVSQRRSYKADEAEQH